ncbi:unnamed protein product [Nesidiocoris tenuis]|uniref:Uncharacterized protein n=1 Tax=Nesidiocoris tenuis TaxID=355587 RepID=A0A6H5G4E2_9HEMI|nr:unnamed protein product [Nesidiocoris tenuis]
MNENLGGGARPGHLRSSSKNNRRFPHPPDLVAGNDCRFRRDALEIKRPVRRRPRRFHERRIQPILFGHQYALGRRRVVQGYCHADGEGHRQIQKLQQWRCPFEDNLLQRRRRRWQHPLRPSNRSQAVNGSIGIVLKSELKCLSRQDLTPCLIEIWITHMLVFPER